MPKETFFNLPEVKREKILTSAKREFARAGIKDSSIQKIIEEAKIPRGSFYQYFESKEDLLSYLLKEHAEKMNKNLETTIKRTKGDVFAVFISIYNYMVSECIEKTETNFFKKVIEELRTGQDDVFSSNLQKHKPNTLEDYYEKINKDNLRVNSMEDFKVLIKLLNAVTKKAIVETFKYESRTKAKGDFLKQIEYIKYGVSKGEQNV